MKKILQTSFFAVMLLSLVSFTAEPAQPFLGTYGVSQDDPSAIQLTLNADATFTFQDFSNPDRPIDVSGNWEVKNNHILLSGSDSSPSFHSKWKIVKDGMVAKSRKGITFYSLGKQ